MYAQSRDCKVTVSLLGEVKGYNYLCLEILNLALIHHMYIVLETI